MKHYVLQRRRYRWDPWEVMAGHRYDTLEEAKAALEALPIKSDCRIAESYIQVRYKEVRL